MWHKLVKTIPRKDWTPTKYSVVWCKHFHDSDIFDYDTYTDTHGVKQKVKQSRIVIRARAVPALFPSLPAYAPSETRKAHAQRLAEINAWENGVLHDFLRDDLIGDFGSCCLNCDEHVNSLTT